MYIVIIIRFKIEVYISEMFIICFSKKEQKIPTIERLY